MIQKKMQPEAGDAVWRILRVERERLVTAVEHNWGFFRGEKDLYAWDEGDAAPGEVDPNKPIDIVTETKARLPIIRYGLDKWFVRRMGTDKFGAWCPTLKRWGMHWWQWTPQINEQPTVLVGRPTLGAALRALRPQLTTEISKGLRTNPRRVAKLAYRAGLLYAISFLLRVPGPWSATMQRVWPVCVDHLAATLEENHREARQRLGEAKEEALGIAPFGAVAPLYRLRLGAGRAQRTLLQLGRLKLVSEERGNAFFTTDKAQAAWTDAVF